MAFAMKHFGNFARAKLVNIEAQISLAGEYVKAKQENGGKTV